MLQHTAWGEGDLVWRLRRGVARLQDSTAALRKRVLLDPRLARGVSMAGMWLVTGPHGVMDAARRARRAPWEPAGWTKREEPGASCTPQLTRAWAGRGGQPSTCVAGLTKTDGADG